MALWVLNSDEVRRALSMPDAIDAMRSAFAALSSGTAVVPHRSHLPIERHAGISLIMPAYLDAGHLEDQALTVKTVSLFDHNRARGLARIQSAVMVFEPDTGRPQAVLEGATLTAIRTAAASGLATELLARSDSETLAIFGAGVQAAAHLEAICCVRPIRDVWIYSRTREKASQWIESLTQHPPSAPTPRHARAAPPRFHLAESPTAALQHADIVCATTTSTDPIFDDADIRPGTHINAVGSFKPTVRELPAKTIIRAEVFVDSREAAWEEAGDLIQPLQDRQIDRQHIRAELGELVLGKMPGRTHPQAITVFKSVGIAIQDAAAARQALANARQLGLGTSVPW